MIRYPWLKNPNPTLKGEVTVEDQIIFSKGADIVSANALVLGTDGNYFDVTGTTAITSIGTIGVGAWAKLHFDGILPLTHHATDLILPGGANITTAAGDEAEFVEYATGDWRCVNYTKADGTAVVGPAGFAVNVETLSGNKTIADGDPTMQILDPGGADRDVYLPATPAADAEFTIVNADAYDQAYYLEVQISGDSNYFTRLYASSSARFVFHSTDGLWRCTGPGFQRTRTAANTYDSGHFNTQIGYGANARNGGTASGTGALADTNGAAFGNGTNGSTSGAVVGRGGDGANYGAVLGEYGNTNDNYHAVALGRYGSCQRRGTVAKGCSVTANSKIRTFEAFWNKDISGGAGATEILLRDSASDRCTVLASSSMSFTIVVTARDGTADESARWTFEGLITRDGSNNTTLKWLNSNTDYEDDATWDCTVSADDTNEALIITCTPDGTNTTQFYAHGICREVIE